MKTKNKEKEATKQVSLRKPLDIGSAIREASKPVEAKTKQAKAPKVKEYLGDKSKTRECPYCHKIFPLTTQYFWLYQDLRKGANIEDNLYWSSGCRECYKKYRAGELKLPTTRKAKTKVASKKKTKPTGETRIKALKVSLVSPLFITNSEDKVKQVIPITKNHYIIKEVVSNGTS